MAPLSPEDLVAGGTLGPRMLAFLGACVRGKANIVISGGTGAGKTTFLNVISSLIPDRERLITIEDAAELRLGKSHVIGLEARPPNVEGRGKVTVRDLVRNALRMRPDRIIVGEVRGGEALDMLQAMNTGHDGSLSTAHANSPRHLLWRLETMALMSDIDLPVEHVRGQIASALDVIVQMARLADGSRKVTDVCTVEGFHDGRPVLEHVFRLDRSCGPTGVFVGSGREPALAGVLVERGERLPDGLFGGHPDVVRSPAGVRGGPGDSTDPGRPPAVAAPAAPGDEFVLEEAMSR